MWEGYAAGDNMSTQELDTKEGNNHTNRYSAPFFKSFLKVFQMTAQGKKLLSTSTWSHAAQPFYNDSVLHRCTFALKDPHYSLHTTRKEKQWCVYNCNMHFKRVINKVRMLQSHANSQGFLEAPGGPGSVQLQLLWNTQPGRGKHCID